MRVFRQGDEVRGFAQECAGRFAAQREGDRLGHTIHLACAAFWCFFLSWPTTYCEIALVPVVVCWVVRMTGQYRVLVPLGWNRACWWALGLVGWTALSVLWSEEPSRWADDVGPMRYAGVLVLLWPVMDRRRVLIAVVAAGLMCGNLSQIAHALGVWTGNGEWLPWKRDAQRLSGWWDPVVGGSLLCGALGLHVGGAVFAEKMTRGRVLAIVMCVVTLACIGLSGTRGAWIGAAGVMVVAGMMWLWRMMRPWEHVRRGPARQRGKKGGGGGFGAIIIGIAVVTLVVNVAMLLPGVRPRMIRGVEEITLALEKQDYQSDTGARLLMWKEGVAACIERPLTGVGAGGYHAWAVRHIREGGKRNEIEAIEPGKRGGGGGGGIHRHAHSWPLHTAATTGIVGVALTAGVIVCVLVGGSRRAMTEGRAVFVRERGYDLGPMLAAVGLMCAGVFDSILVNQQTSAMWWTMAALCLTWRPGDFSKECGERRGAEDAETQRTRPV